jgi:2-oxoglutarate dehydrogenase E1 component
VAILALEQVAPFPYLEFVNNIKKFKNAEVFWVQEEHKNQGCWNYVESRIESVLRKVGLVEKSRVHYVGRKSSSTSATGYHDVHEKELEKFLSEAFN